MFTDFPFPDIPQLSFELNQLIKWFAILVIFYLIISVVGLTLKCIIYSRQIVSLYRRVTSRTLTGDQLISEEDHFTV